MNWLFCQPGFDNPPATVWGACKFLMAVIASRLGGMYHGRDMADEPFDFST
jgi:hypothetical protein